MITHARPEIAPASRSLSLSADVIAGARAQEQLQDRPLLDAVSPLELLGLPALMELSGGAPAVVVGLIDGPVATAHPDLANSRVLDVTDAGSAACTDARSAACEHGTFVAGILVARRGSAAPAICPACTLISRPVLPEHASRTRVGTSATVEELASAIVDCVEAGVRVLNLSVTVSHSSPYGVSRLREALDLAGRRGVLLVAAAGNAAAIGASALTGHPAVLPVVAYDGYGRPLPTSSLGISVGRRGLGAPGDSVISLGAHGPPIRGSGSSVAAPFVSGAIALLWSLFPSASPAAIRSAILSPHRRRTLVPPLLHVPSAYESLSRSTVGRGAA